MISDIYVGDPKQLVDKPLTGEMFGAIGEIIRVCAEIEDCLNLAICSFAEVSEAKMLIFLGRTPISRKSEIAQTFAAVRPDDALKVFKKVWTKQITSLVKHRNVLAHGVYLGQTPEGEFAFLSGESLVNDERAHGQTVFIYSHKLLRGEIDDAIALIPIIEQRLKIQELRKRHSAPQLGPHPKAQKTSMRKKGR